MSEQLALYQFWGNGAAVNSDKRSRAARTRTVDESGDNLFACTGLAVNVDGCLTSRYLCTFYSQLFGRKRRTNKIARRFASATLFEIERVSD